MAAALPFIPAAISGISAIGGLISGKKQADTNQQLVNSQNQQLLQQTQMAERLASSVNRAEYQQQASADSRAALRDVFSGMAARGMGRSTATDTAMAGASAQIRSAYGKQYLTDRLQAISGAAGVFGSAANTPRMGFASDPYAGFRAGMQGIGSAAAYMQTRNDANAASSLVTGAPGDSAFGVHYKYP